MLTNYLKIALRNLLRHKAFSFINIAGLAIGMACSILIMLWVTDELSYDRFHKNAGSIYRVVSHLPELDVHAAVSSTPLAQAGMAGIPQIRDAVRISSGHKDLLQVGDRVFEEKRILYVDSTFFRMFSFAFTEGNPSTALDNPEGIVITEEMKLKYFGEGEALGKTIRKNHQDDFTVAGVLVDIPGNSHLQFDFIQPMAFLARSNRDLKENVWDNFNFYTYFQFDESVSESVEVSAIADQLTEIYKKNEPNLKVQFSLQPLTDIHLRSSFLADFLGHGNAQYVYIFIVVGIFILVVACINFMNLATARSARRAKEVGLRKVAGAARPQLIRQFLAESSIISFLALIFALVIVIIALPFFNELAGKQLAISFLNLDLLLGLLAITLLTGLFAGSYPALFLSGFLPVKVLKGDLKSGASSSLFRNIMVVVQFSVSIILLVGTLVVYNQLNFIQQRNLGYDKENLIYVPMTGDLWSKYQTYRTALEQHELTKNFTFVSDLPTNLVNATIGVDWEGKDPDSQPLFVNMAIDENFMDVFRTTLLTGRTFSREFTADSSSYIVNEEALKTIGLDAESAIGKPFTLWDKTGTIVGVVKDFNFKPVQQPIEPLILRLNTWGGTAVVRTQAGKTEETIAQLEKTWKELNPEYPFSYNFVDEDLARLYTAEQQLGRLFNVFAGLAIFISCLGLYGLSAFLAERRTKELGVRKVLGASVPSLVFLLSRTFTVPVLVAMVVATPVAWYAIGQWLDGFAYHVDLHWSIFAAAFATALLVAWLTVGYESLKAALANPAQSLKDE